MRDDHASLSFRSDSADGTQLRARVVVTGLGAVCALGPGVSAIVRAMMEGRDGLSAMARFDVAPLHPVSLAGWLRAPWERGEPASLDVWTRAAAREAWDSAGLDASRVAPARIAVVSGTTLGEEGALSRSADAAAEEVGARGPRWTISTACASSANSIGLGRDLLEWGDADVVIVGGVEKLVIEIMAGFSALGVLGEHKCAPFGENVGTTLGEGAGFLVLEREEDVARRRGPVRAFLLGYGLSCDAWHETSPEPRGEGVARAITACLRDASVGQDQVDYVNAHATGTSANDDAEWRGIRKALGARARAIPVSASKGFLGHTQGAAGVLEAVATIACMEIGRVPPSIRVGKGRSNGPADTVSETGQAREANVDIALSNSAAFGGANAVIAVGRALPSPRSIAMRAVSLEGVGVVRTASGAPRDALALASACGDADVHAADPSTLYAIASIRAALARADVKLSGAARERTGLFGACVGPPRASVEEYRESLKRGVHRASAPVFARTVAHAPMGAVSRAFGIRGPMTMVVGDGVAGLLAVAYAARWLAVREDTDRIVAGGIDERPIDSLDDEGGAFAVLCSAGAGPRIVGVATAGSHSEAVDQALRDAGCESASIDAWLTPDRAAACSYGSAMTLATAVRALQEGARRVVVSAQGTQGAVVLVLEASQV